MRKANQLVGATFGELVRHLKPGVTTLQLDKIAEHFIRDNGAIPTFKNLPNPYGEPFPANICISVNDVVAHGIPDDKTILKDGDIVSIDCGVFLDGFNGCSCYTFCVGEVKPEIKKLLQVTKEALYVGIKNAVAGKHVGDIGYAIQTCAEESNYGIVRELTGHGIGRKMHEDPQIPNYGKQGAGVLLKDGMYIAIEPILTMGNRAIGLMPDHWTVRTIDGKSSAHFAHTVVVRRGEAEILSSFDEVEQLEANK